jgi:hypothetical protein
VLENWWRRFIRHSVIFGDGETMCKNLLVRCPAASFGVAIVMIVSGCGGGRSDFIGGSRDTEVVGLSADDEDVVVGSGTVVNVELRYDNFDVGTGDDFYVSVLLPAGLSFRLDSAEIQASFDNDKRVRPQVITCGRSESSYLFFELDSGDLGGSVGGGGRDATLSFTADAVSAAGVVTMAARASEGSAMPQCGETFEAQETAQLTLN